MFGIDFQRALFSIKAQNALANSFVLVNTISRLSAAMLVAVVGGGAVADFTPYQGAQQNWSTARGAFVSNQAGVPAYYGAATACVHRARLSGCYHGPIRQRKVVPFAARQAKEIGGDAIVVLKSNDCSCSFTLMSQRPPQLADVFPNHEPRATRVWIGTLNS